MSPNESAIERLVAMTERLTESLKADIAALERGRPSEMRIIAPEIQQLCALYGREAASLKALRPRSLPAPARIRLTEVTKNFNDALTLHARRLACVRNASEGMIRAIVDDVERKRRITRPYAPNVKQPRTPGAMLYNSVA